jgi:hypothetical protein
MEQRSGRSGSLNDPTLTPLEIFKPTPKSKAGGLFDPGVSAALRLQNLF